MFVYYCQVCRRSLRTGITWEATAGEKQLASLLTEKLTPSYVAVKDISGGCGQAYEVWIDSDLFEGKRLIQKHRMVNEVRSHPILISCHSDHTTHTLK